MTDTLARQRHLPWHNQATALADGLMTSEEALQAAGLDWEIKLKENFHNIYRGGKTIRQKSRALSVIRTDTDAEIGVVGKRYRTLSNRESFKFLDELAGGDAKFEAAGSQNDGARVYVVMKLAEGMTVLGSDRYDQYVLFLTSHDGSLAVTATPIATRIACTNMFRTLVVQGKGEAKVWKAQHLSTLGYKVQDTIAVERTRELIAAGQEKFQRLAESLVKLPIRGSGSDIGTVRARYDELMDLGLPWQGTARDKLVDEAFEVWTGSTTIDPDWRYTGWGLLQGVKEYLDHVRVYETPNSRFNNVVFTLGATIERNLTTGLSRLAW